MALALSNIRIANQCFTCSASSFLHKKNSKNSVLKRLCSKNSHCQFYFEKFRKRKQSLLQKCFDQTHWRTPHQQYNSSFYHGSEYGRPGAINAQTDAMTDEKATRILRQCEFSVTIKEDFDTRNHNPVSSFDSNILASNKHVEDRRAQAKYHHETSLGMLFGVFDGHGGSQCAQAVSDRLFLYIALSLVPHKDVYGILRELDQKKPWPALLEWYRDSNGPRGSTLTQRQEKYLRKFLEKRLDGRININNVADALHHAFVTIDRNILRDAENQIDYSSHKHPHADLKAIDTAMSGSTACVSYISDGLIHVANVGDSRAVLGSMDPLTPGRWIATSLSRKHNAWNINEVNKILECHPGEEKTVIVNDRLLGSLAPLRAFGNARFKLTADVIKTIAQLSADYDEDIGVGGDYRVPEQISWVLPNYKTPPYLTAKPEIIQHKIQPNDRFLVLATDGLWEILHKSDVVQIIGEQIQRMENRDVDFKTEVVNEMDILYDDSSFFGYEDNNIATHAIRNCIGQTFDGPSRRQFRAMLSLPVEESRFYRDDVTVTVIKLKQNTPA